MEKNKSIVEQALLQAETLEEAVKQNAKGILSSIMKEELNNLLKEEKEDEDPEEEKDIEGEETPEDDETPEEDSITDEMPDDLEGEELPPENEEIPGKEAFGEFEGDEEEPLDLRGASDDEVGKIFQSMNPTDAIIVAKDDDTVQVKIEDKDYIIKLNEQLEDDDDPEFDDKDIVDKDIEADAEDYEDNLDLGDEDEQIYEIELDDEMDECGSSEAMEGEYTEAARTKWNAHGDKGPTKRLGIKGKKLFKAGSGVSEPYSKNINEEVKTLKKQNAEYKKALLIFKDKLNEIAVFNANLAYAVRILTEHTTTKSEKLNILKRFDSVSTITESKQLYNKIVAELSNKKPITETVADKISSMPQSSSTQILSETKTYEDTQFKRMKVLMGLNK